MNTAPTQPPAELAAPLCSALPCPHCGAPARKNRYHGDRSRIFYGCSRDECNFTYSENDEAAALSAWNQRWPNDKTTEADIEREVTRWKDLFVTFAIVHAGRYGEEHYGKGCMHFTHYDLLKEAGARLVDFKRCGDSLNAKLCREGGEKSL